LDFSAINKSEYCPLVTAAGKPCGHVQTSLLPLLLDMRTAAGVPVFAPLEEDHQRTKLLGLLGNSNVERTAGLTLAAEALVSNGLLDALHGERVPVTRSWGEPAVALCDRFIAPFVGAPSAGVHLHCYTRAKATGEMHVWMAKRCASKATFPSRWDPTVAGGQPHDLSVYANLVKEAQEEAGVPEELLEAARSAGAVSLNTARPDGSCLKHSVYFIFDLLVDSAFTPRAVDGEVERFELWSMADLDREVRAADTCLSPRMRAVMADFLIRHGLITPDNEGADYPRILSCLHTPPIGIF